jgi:hypothetical protein
VAGRDHSHDRRLHVVAQQVNRSRARPFQDDGEDGRNALRCPPREPQESDDAGSQENSTDLLKLARTCADFEALRIFRKIDAAEAAKLRAARQACWLSVPTLSQIYLLSVNM